MTIDVETLRQCIAVVDRLGSKPPSDELAYHWGWKDACSKIDLELRKLIGPSNG